MCQFPFLVIVTLKMYKMIADSAILVLLFTANFSLSVEPIFYLEKNELLKIIYKLHEGKREKEKPDFQVETLTKENARLQAIETRYQR